MNILITGSTGLLGAALQKFLKQLGHQVIQLVRHPVTRPGFEIFWDPENKKIDHEALGGMSAVIHLAGENIFGRWTSSKKEKILKSRVEGTEFLSKVFKRLAAPPQTFLVASAIGYYGNQGDELLDEESPSGKGFLAKVCREWEAAANKAEARGIRVVNLRFGLILDSKGGALQKMLFPFRLGLGGILGNGKQYMSWISLEDALKAIYHCLINNSLTGPVNIVSPHPVTNREFTKTLGEVLSRPTLLKLPASILKLGLGEAANELLLSSTRVTPSKLLETNFIFRYPELKGALQHLIKKS